MARDARLVLQGLSAERCVFNQVVEIVKNTWFSECRVVSPFLSEGGVRLVVELCELARVTAIHWTVGLDGVITSPGALKAVKEARLTKTAKAWNQQADSYLHAKVYEFIGTQDPELLVYIGSSNATEGGLLSNIEGGVLISASGADAVHIHKDVSGWIQELERLPASSDLTDGTIQKYSSWYERPRSKRVKKLARVVGVRNSGVLPTSDYSWIEVAVRGGSANQIEICKEMARFFTCDRDADEVTFELVDARNGACYRDNSFRFRPGNVGFRVEVDTDLARSLNLSAASKRRDIVMFARIPTGAGYTIEIVNAKSPKAAELIRRAEATNSLHWTVPGPHGRRYY